MPFTRSQQRSQGKSDDPYEVVPKSRKTVTKSPAKSHASLTSWKISPEKSTSHSKYSSSPSVINETPPTGVRQYEGVLESVPSWDYKHLSMNAPKLESLPRDARILSWEFVAQGSYAEIRCVQIITTSGIDTYCLKLFPKEHWRAFENECEAYRYMKWMNITRCIPKIYYTGKMNRHEWDGDQPDDYRYCHENEFMYGIVMEFFFDAEYVDLRRADLTLLGNITSGLNWIHSVVIHGNISEKNILLVKEKGVSRVVWIGFSKALLLREEPWTCIDDIDWNGCSFLISKERDEFRNLLLENTDPRILTMEILDTKFPPLPLPDENPRSRARSQRGGSTAIPQSTLTPVVYREVSVEPRQPDSYGEYPRLETPPPLSAPTQRDIPRTPSSSNHSLSEIYGQHIPVPQQNGSPTYLRAAYSTFFCLHLIHGLISFLHLPTSSTPIETSLAFGCTTTLSLGLFFFLIRDVDVKGGPGQAFVRVFLGHTTCVLACGLYALAIQWERSQIQAGLGVVLSLMYLYWVICGTLAVRNSFAVEMP